MTAAARPLKSTAATPAFIHGHEEVAGAGSRCRQRGVKGLARAMPTYSTVCAGHVEVRPRFEFEIEARGAKSLSMVIEKKRMPGNL